MSPRVSTLPVLLTIVLLSHAIHLTSATCYRLDGKPFKKIRVDDGDWIPCYPDLETSHCCSASDYCMSNGLCLNAGSNNFFSIQGCTDPNWGGPCVYNAACEESLVDNPFPDVFQCGQTSEGMFHYCCGKSPSCCENKGTLINIAAVGQIRLATNIVTQTQTLSSGTVAPAIETVTQTLSAVTVTATPAVDGPPDGNKTTIGLGAGLGAVVLALAGACLFLANKLRKKQPLQQTYGSGHQPVPQQEEFYKSAVSATTAHNPTAAPIQQQHMFTELPSTDTSYWQELDSYPTSTGAR